ncbi:tRNA (adenosine(37)-N6)-threonylcarbamoyltransferase complex dimerization subunit type 1 TsaB [Roseivirga sp.]|uniref:tRNA (adenosine(37)-N6)-threonylcarbamoyltransferase complex dimerization subunit type 1 TsaB n=1 Tax=Roseivirga sp. TaxID=1964215 RepID=UPI003B5277C6
MSLILSIETATTVCSVALTDGQQIVARKKLYTDKSHANQLTLLVTEMMKEAGLVLADLKAVAISEGPGSYTGLRIGISTAKGLCYALNIPLIGISTLKAMAHEVNATMNEAGGLLCPMIDARRMEVYTALYSPEMTEVMAPHPKILDESSFEETLKESGVLFFGNGAPKFSEVLQNENARFVEEISPSAWAIGQLAAERFANQQFEDLAYFEPSYLKEFQATTPKSLL